MASSRRRLLLATLAAFGAALLAPVGAMASAAGSRLAAWARPEPVGTSASRCAACGAAGHAMLDAACPARRTIRS